MSISIFEMTATGLVPGHGRFLGQSNHPKQVDSRNLDFSYLEKPLISKLKSSPCFNMEMQEQVTKMLWNLVPVLSLWNLRTGNKNILLFATIFSMYL